MGKIGSTNPVGQVALASFIGTTVEWYDYFLYGTAAAVVFAPLFFPDSAPLIGTLLAFATFGVGFAARPSVAYSSATSETESAARPCW